ncbi:MAG: organic solvent ABC transporter ATP-binding protein [Melioribacteraceae bacterium]|nr:MAG: organic solvent ABC transporter ATP-binding protein [Melioribacteraceae bacterium]
MANTLIKIRNLLKQFGSHKVLDHIDLDVIEGENLVVFGQSGTGKSVLLKCIIGLLKPDEGEVEMLGKNVVDISLKELNEIRKQTGFLFQGAALYDSMTVRQNLEFPLKRHFQFTQEELDEKVESVLEHVSLAEAVDKMPSELSGGMRKRIGLARSIITEPKIMFYDEPTTGLDPITSKEISDLIMTMQKRFNMTSIAVTHDLICAKIIADRAIFLRSGKIAYEGTLDNLVDSDDKFLKNFFSDEIIKENQGS